MLITYRFYETRLRGEFELDRTRSINNIAENSFALGHETHNTHTIAKVDISSELHG